jgi:hypothetical protein
LQRLSQAQPLSAGRKRFVQTFALGTPGSLSHIRFDRLSEIAERGSRARSAQIVAEVTLDHAIWNDLCTGFSPGGFNLYLRDFRLSQKHTG